MNSSWTVSFRTATYRAAALCLILCPITLLGCSGGNQGRVSGKVTYNGQPVTDGTIGFAPLAAEGAGSTNLPASGAVKQDGTYTLVTQGGATGATVGRNRVSYTPPNASGGTAGKPAPQPFAGLVPKMAEVEVKPGANPIDIELVQPGAK